MVMLQTKTQLICPECSSGIDTNEGNIQCGVCSWPHLPDFQDKNDVARWLNRRRLINARGASANVYGIGGLAIKIGMVVSEEAQRQQMVFERTGLALPVLLYRESYPVPASITHSVCPIHSPHRRYNPDGWYCHCNEPMGIMVMPLATYGPEDPFGQVRAVETVVGAFPKIDGFFGGIEVDLDRHAMIWNDHIVLVDWADCNALENW